MPRKRKSTKPRRKSYKLKRVRKGGIYGGSFLSKALRTLGRTLKRHKVLSRGLSGLSRTGILGPIGSRIAKYGSKGARRMGYGRKRVAYKKKKGNGLRRGGNLSRAGGALRRAGSRGGRRRTCGHGKRKRKPRRKTVFP